jgi:predicted nucleic acid-binding protein
VIVLDAGALIALINERDAHHVWARELFTSTTGEEWVISSLNLAEVMVHPVRAGKAEEFMRGIEGLRLRVEGTQPAHATELARLRAETSLKMPDVIALHLASGLSASLATVDRRLAEKASEFGCEVHAPQFD